MLPQQFVNLIINICISTRKAISHNRQTGLLCLEICKDLKFRTLFYLAGSISETTVTMFSGLCGFNHREQQTRPGQIFDVREVTHHFLLIQFLLFYLVCFLVSLYCKQHNIMKIRLCYSNPVNSLFEYLSWT